MMLLKVSGVHFSYGHVLAVRGVSLEVAAGQVVALLGVNGAGKSTLLALIAGLLRPDAGVIEFDGSPVQGVRADRMVRRGVALVPERRDLFPQMSVAENLAMGAYLRRDTKGVREDSRRVFSYFPPLEARRRQLAGTLSGGEQQMLAIGRALMGRPRLLLLDEPSLGLAPLIVVKIFEVLEQISQADRMTMLVVEQNTRIALEASSYAYVLETGRIALAGSSQELLRSDLIRQSYLGAA